MTDQELIRYAKKWREDYYLNGDHIILLDAIIDRLTAIQSENAEKDKEIKRLTFMMDSAKNVAIKRGRELSRVEAERDAGRPSAEVLEAIDELVEFARDRMSIGMWLGYVNVLNEWRGAQGEG